MRAIGIAVVLDFLVDPYGTAVCVGIGDGFLHDPGIAQCRCVNEAPFVLPFLVEPGIVGSELCPRQGLCVACDVIALVRNVADRFDLLQDLKVENNIFSDGKILTESDISDFVQLV